jgi:hypothetical protein
MAARLLFPQGAKYACESPRPPTSVLAVNLASQPHPLSNSSSAHPPHPPIHLFTHPLRGRDGAEPYLRLSITYATGSSPGANVSISSILPSGGNAKSRLVGPSPTSTAVDLLAGGTPRIWPMVVANSSSEARGTRMLTP